MKLMKLLKLKFSTHIATFTNCMQQTTVCSLMLFGRVGLTCTGSNSTDVATMSHQPKQDAVIKSATTAAPRRPLPRPLPPGTLPRYMFVQMLLLPDIDHCFHKLNVQFHSQAYVNRTVFFKTHFVNFVQAVCQIFEHDGIASVLKKST